MTSCYVLLINGLSMKEQRQLVDLLKAHHCGWWKYLDGSILVTSNTPIDPGWLLEQVKNAAASREAQPPSACRRRDPRPTEAAEHGANVYGAMAWGCRPSRVLSVRSREPA